MALIWHKGLLGDIKRALLLFYLKRGNWRVEGGDRRHQKSKMRQMPHPARLHSQKLKHNSSLIPVIFLTRQPSLDHFSSS